MSKHILKNFVKEFLKFSFTIFIVFLIPFAFSAIYDLGKFFGYSITGLILEFFKFF